MKPEDEIHELGARPAASRLLRCTRTGRYWSADGWRNQLTEAAQFTDEMDAARACVNNQLKDIELVLVSRGGAEFFSTQIR